MVVMREVSGINFTPYDVYNGTSSLLLCEFHLPTSAREMMGFIDMCGIFTVSQIHTPIPSLLPKDSSRLTLCTGVDTINSA